MLRDFFSRFLAYFLLFPQSYFQCIVLMCLDDLGTQALYNARHPRCDVDGNPLTARMAKKAGSLIDGGYLLSKKQIHSPQAPAWHRWMKFKSETLIGPLNPEAYKILPSGRPAVVVEHRGDWKWAKEFWNLTANWHWKAKLACHMCCATHKGLDSSFGLI